METKGAVLSGINVPIEVVNFPLEYADAAKSGIEKLSVLRRVEWREHRALGIRKYSDRLKVVLENDGGSAHGASKGFNGTAELNHVGIIQILF